MASSLLLRPLLSLLLLPMLLPMAALRAVLDDTIAAPLVRGFVSFSDLGRDLGACLNLLGAWPWGEDSLERDRLRHAAMVGEAGLGRSRVMSFVGRGLVHDHWTAGGFLGADGAALRI